MIPIAPEIIFSIGNFPITNTLLDTLLVDIILFALTYFIYKNIQLIPGFFQNTVEVTIEYTYNLAENLSGKNAKQIFPWAITFIIFIGFANLSSLLPGIGAIGFFSKKEFIPIFRSSSTDLNTTAGLALTSLIATHIMSFKTLGFKEYITRFITIDNPFMLPIGLLEIVSEFTKLIAFSFRLFGNIYAEEILLSQLSSVFAFILPVPLMLYDMFVGIVQAAVFGLLTMAFMAILTTPHHVEADH